MPQFSVAVMSCDKQPKREYGICTTDRVPESQLRGSEREYIGGGMRFGWKIGLRVREVSLLYLSARLADGRPLYLSGTSMRPAVIGQVLNSQA